MGQMTSVEGNLSGPLCFGLQTSFTKQSEMILICIIVTCNCAWLFYIMVSHCAKQ